MRRAHPSRALSALETLAATRPWIMISGDLALATGITALALAISKIPRGLDMTIAVSLLLTAAAGITVQALAREDCNTALAECIAREHTGQVTWHHHLHSPASALPSSPSSPLRWYSHARSTDS